MARAPHEFQCDGGQPGRKASEDGRPDSGGNCGWYNYPPLDDRMHGNYTIVCGNCGHHHYRVIKNGVVTSDRHNKELGEAHVLHVLKSQTQKEKRKLGLVAQLRQMATAGLMTGGSSE